LRWEGEPEGTGAYALVLEDPDAPAGPWIHWVLYNIPASQHSLGAGQPRRLELTSGARHGRCWGVNRFARIGYYGPLPPSGPSHRYRFTLTALDGPLDLRPGATPFEVANALQVHGLGDAQLVACYSRQLVTPAVSQVTGRTL
jgi:Raf kinase inhibitor-like YbhB/YbcL family protein